MVPTIVVPGFYGFAREADGLPEDADPSRLLECLLLSLVEGASDPPGTYVVMLPEEGVLVTEQPPEPTLEVLGLALPAHRARNLLSYFVYDWRRDLVASAAELAGCIGGSDDSELDLVGVGPGGLVVRYLLESGAHPDVAARVRRLILLGTPGAGIPATVLLFNGLLSVFEPDLAFTDLLEHFPAAFQLLPPSGAGSLTRAGAPAERVDVFASDAAFLAGAGEGAAGPRLAAVLRERARAVNACLHERLEHGYSPGWQRGAVFASAAHATFSQLQLALAPSGPSWEDLAPADCSGDGVVPVVGAVPHPTMRHFLVPSRHLELGADPIVVARLEALLSGPLA